MSTIYYKTSQNYFNPRKSEDLYVPQPFLNYGGLTKMLNDDYRYNIKDSSNIVYSQPRPEPKNNRRAMSARQRYDQNKIMQEERAKKLNQRYVINKTNPNTVEEAQNSFWMTHINSSDIYRSFIKGTNPWARSSAFTQPLQRTRGAIGFYQNAYNNNMYSGFPGTYEEQKRLLLEKYEQERKMREENERLMNAKNESGIRQFIVDKILKGCAKKGWIGLRSLKCYLRSISPHKCDIIDKNSFKYYLDKQGIILDNDEVNEICEIFDINKNDHLNYIEFLNSIRYVTEFRAQQIEDFKEQVKEREKNCIFFSKLLRIADMRYHPEVIKHLKNVYQIINEYKNNWDALKIDDVISEEHFRQFFYDVSSVVDNDRDFTQILKALGYK
jgi:hypothetical protein